MSKIKDSLKQLNSKVIVKVATLVFGVLLIIVSTIVDIGLDPTKIDFYSWLTNSLVLTGIMVYGLVMGESLGKDNQTRNVNGLYQSNLNRYNGLLKELEPTIIYFTQFYEWFRKKEIRRKKINYLKEHDIDLEWCELIVDNVKKSDLHQLSLEEGLKLENGIVIPQMDEQQLEHIGIALSGKIKTNDPQPNYYLTAFGTSKVKSELDEPENIDRQIKINTHANRIFKIIISLTISIVWAMITVKEFMGGDSETARMTAWTNLVSRLTALFTSFVSGWSSAVIDTKLRAQKLDGKYSMLVKFKSAYNNKEFETLSKQEQAKKKYEEVMERKKKELENVVIPEIIDNEKKDKLLLEEKSVIML